MTATLTSTDIDNDRCPACGKALSRLTTPPLPEEIAGLIERLDRWMPADRYSATELMNEAAATLHALAQENERLKAAAVPLCIGPPLIGILAKEGAWQSSTGQCVVAADELRAADPYERIRTLEAERDQMIRVARIWQERYEEAIGGQVAIRAKTIEECLAKLPEDTPAYVCAALRALAQTDEASQKERR